MLKLSPEIEREDKWHRPSFKLDDAPKAKSSLRFVTLRQRGEEM